MMVGIIPMVDVAVGGCSPYMLVRHVHVDVSVRQRQRRRRKTPEQGDRKCEQAEADGAEHAGMYTATALAPTERFLV